MTTTYVPSARFGAASYSGRFRGGACVASLRGTQDSLVGCRAGHRSYGGCGGLGESDRGLVPRPSGVPTSDCWRSPVGIRRCGQTPLRWGPASCLRRDHRSVSSVGSASGKIPGSLRARDIPQRRTDTARHSYDRRSDSHRYATSYSGHYTIRDRERPLSIRELSSACRQR